MKIANVAVIAAIAGLLVGIAFYAAKRSSSHGYVSVAHSSTETHRRSQEQTSEYRGDQPISRPPNEVAAGKPTDKGVEYLENGMMLFGDGVPAHTTVLRLVMRHPEWGVTPEQATRLQSAYNELTDKRARLEVSLATITRVNADETRIVIPSFFDESGRPLLEEWERNIRDSTTVTVEQRNSMTNILTPAFLADNNALGKYPMALTVQVVHGETYDFAVRRTVPVTDPATGAVKGVISGIDTVKAATLGVYDKQREFFPSRK